MTAPVKKVVLYTTPVCPYCEVAKKLLKQYEATFEEIDVTDPKAREEMIRKAGGRMTVPQIFIGATHVGGFDDLYTLHKAGTLSSLFKK